MANGNLMHGFLNDMEMGEEIDPSTIPDTIVEEVVAANNEVVESGKDLEALNAANTELVEINNEMDVALESNAGPAVMRLVLNRYANLKSKLGIPVSGLEADSKSLDVTADDIKNAKEESKGVFAKIGDFISKVWKAIKDGIAKVWAKMKEFWAWLTGKNKKAEEKIIKSEIAKAAVSVAANTNVDLENEEELSRAIKKEVNFDASWEEFGEILSSPNLSFNAESLNKIRANKVKAVKTLEELMDNRISQKFPDVAKKLIELLSSFYIMPFNKETTFTFNGDAAHHNASDFLTDYKNKDLENAKKVISNIIAESTNRTFSRLKKADDIFSPIEQIKDYITGSLLNTANAKIEEFEEVIAYVENELSDSKQNINHPITINLNYIVEGNAYFTENKITIKMATPFSLLSTDVKLSFLDNFVAPKWNSSVSDIDFKSIVIDKQDKAINDTYKMIDGVTKKIDNILKLTESKRVDYKTLSIIKDMATTINSLNKSIFSVISKQSELLSVVADMLDTTEALAELAKK